MSEERPPHVAKEIEELPPWGTPLCEEHVRTHGAALRPETLVHLLRTSSGGDTALFPICGRLLIGQKGQTGFWTGGHCEGIIMNLAKHYHFDSDPELLYDFRADCYAGMWKAVHAGYAEKPFWEHNFYHCMKQLCIQVARKVRGRRTRERSEQALPESEDGEDLLPDPVSGEDLIFHRILKDDLLAAIRTLPERQAVAALLAWVDERPIEGDAEDSVAKVMGISPRAVYKLLVKARQRLLERPNIQKYKEEA